jgi:tRNA A37 threonylcarbamoyladenosine dehydratase
MEPTSELLLGRRNLEGIPGYELLEDIHWNNKRQKWVLRIRLTLPLNSSSVPRRIPNITQWYILIDATYPWGRIVIYPDQQSGITDTFQHQNCNRDSTEFPWRTGDLCVKTSLHSFARRGYDSEPYDASTRLGWHVERCKTWLELANINQLSVNGEPFELPHYPSESLKTVAFLEDDNSFLVWHSFAENSGIVHLKYLTANSHVVFVDAFHGFAKNSLVNIQWGHYLEDTAFNETAGIWIRISSVPVLPPWKAPLTWSELFSALALQGINLEVILKKAYAKVWKQQITILLLGFPIPATVGEQPHRMHWIAIQLDKPAILKGFRPNSPELFKVVVRQLFCSDKSLAWLSSENWHRTEINARGHLISAITSNSILIIGAGSVGSVLAELLTRSGCYQITVMDDDLAEIGNMSRHTLTMANLRSCKAKSVASRLNKIFPYNTINSIDKTLKQSLKYNKDLLLSYDVIIDATASDQVLYELSQAKHNIKSKFISISLGLNAKRLFCFTAGMSASLATDFSQQIQPWLKKETNENQGIDLPRDGLGCWHPLFPARVDDVWMLVSASIKLIECFLLEPNIITKLCVLEQTYNDDGFSGIMISNDVS